MKKLKTISRKCRLDAVVACCLLLAGPAAAINVGETEEFPVAPLCVILVAVGICVLVHLGVARLFRWGMLAGLIALPIFLILTAFPNAPFLFVVVPVLLGAGTIKKIAVPAARSIRSLHRGPVQFFRESFGLAPVCVPARRRLFWNQPRPQCRVDRQSPVQRRHDEQQSSHFRQD